MYTDIQEQILKEAGVHYRKRPKVVVSTLVGEEPPQPEPEPEPDEE